MKNMCSCPLLHFCITQKHDYESCDDMVRRYNAGLLLPPEFVYYKSKPASSKDNALSDISRGYEQC